MRSSTTRLSMDLAIGSGSLWNMTQHLPVTTFIGAGGKTTCLRSITQEIESTGLQVVATTTTKVYPEEHMMAWRNLNPPPKQKGACFWYDKVEDESGKWIGPSVTAVDAAIAEDLLPFGFQSNQAEVKLGNLDARTVPDVYDLHDLHGQRFWVIEGDGARERKLKCWESYEPQIPKSTDCAVLVLDRGLWGHVLQAEQVHRPNRCSDLLGRVWKAESAWSYFLSSPVFDPQYTHMSWAILLNSPEKNIENKDVRDPMNSLDLLQDLWNRWVEIQQNTMVIEKRPRHLRMAVGDAKEGDLKWFDLW